MDGARAKSRQSSHRKPSAVAAIDFGTTNTGYAYYFRPAQYRPIAANDIEVKKQVTNAYFSLLRICNGTLIPVSNLTKTVALS
ncbi:hypothetical protein DPMN_097622 [Dreissena polymorpha]|uniref:Uncharacterized protein n=1 Tax=Dreissena polymorpha TaxID=45954 RepID=A0A9D4R5W5_DREPO|nr:hypothetical protein DPMN_097622 [Dreissena polymorpha]